MSGGLANAVVIGPGRIGCGFAGQLLRASGFGVVFAARQRAVVDYFNRVGAYRVCLVRGQEAQEIIVDGVKAVSTAALDEAAQQISEAHLVITAVGASNLSDIAPLLAAGLRRRSTPINIIAFENLVDAGPRLRDLAGRHLPADFPLKKHGFSGALVERAVTERWGDPTKDELLTFLGDPPDTFTVDHFGLRQPVPRIKGMRVTRNYAAWIQRKMYIFGAGHATCAYLGYLKGYNYVHTAIRDPEIREAVVAAMAEGQRGLAARYGPEIAGDEKDLQEIIARFENAALMDPILRVGRDPQRKLGANDRLVGAARLAAEAGINPEKLALATAAAFCFNNPADPSAADLQREVAADGLPEALRHICGLDSRRGLGRFVAEDWARFAEGWQPGNLLLKLDQMMWARRPKPAARLHGRIRGPGGAERTIRPEARGSVTK